MRRKAAVRLAVLLLVSLSITGCIGFSGSPDKKMIEAVLDRYEQGMKAMNAETLADLLSYPYSSGDTTAILNKEGAVIFFNMVFSFTDAVHEFKFTRRNITISGSEAVADLTAYSRVTMMGETFDSQAHNTLYLRKEAGAWKIYKQIDHDED